MRPAIVTAAALGLTLLATTRAAAQGECRPGKDSNEADAMAQMAVPLAMAPLGTPPERPTSVWIGLDISYISDVDEMARTPTICRPGKEPENTNILDVMPRPRVGVNLPAAFSLEASWVPPITVKQVRANLLGLALRWTAAPAANLAVALRAHATVGVVRAPVTCPDRALADPASECFGGTRSDDHYHPNIYGVDATLGWSLAGGRFHPYVGGGYSRLAPRFQVEFVNIVGVLDDTKVIVDFDRAAVFGGFLWRAGSALDAGAEVYAVPADGVTGRVVVRARLGS